MYALVVEYGPRAGDHPPLAVRWAYRELVARLPGYQRRLELQADGYQRLVEVFLFAAPAAVEAALADAGRRRFAAAHAGGATVEAALLVSAGAPLGTPAVLLRRSRPTSPGGDQVCWRDRLPPAAPVTELW